MKHGVNIWHKLGGQIVCVDVCGCRYICVCRSQHCTISATVTTVVIIYIVTVISQLSRFVESRYEPIIVQSLIAPDRDVITCQQQHT